MVIKNPGVRPDSPYLKAARRIETDISLFLAASPACLLAVTGSKGKSTVSSALYHVLNEAGSAGLVPGKTRLGGNIALSPLRFLNELEEGDRVGLELSSWQLGDLKNRAALLKPRCAVITAIMKDHQDRYDSMEAYVADKRIICRGQDREDATIAEYDSWGRSFLRESRGRPLVYAGCPLPDSSAGGWIDGEDGPGLARLWAGKDAGTIVEAVPEELLTPGRHQKKNLLSAALALLDLGLPSGFIRTALGHFGGIEHRLEFFHEARGIRFYNDSAATIPEAAAAAIRAFERPPVLVSGGTDKNLDFSPLVSAASGAKALILLEGTGSAKLVPLLDKAGVPYRGPFDSLDEAVKAAIKAAESGDSVVLSPGCASFGMFRNEFDRGKKWKEEVLKWT
jgi:UDP-N-acetylmuramoylalanine--D-glutamate ligase